MKLSKHIFLPGSDKQFSGFIKIAEPTGKNILIAGSGTELIAKTLGESNNVKLIVEEQELLVQLKFALSGASNVSVRMMDFDNTDFKDETFDLVYSQASFSVPKRNKIIKEVKRILKKDGLFCIGETVNLKPDIPVFVNDIWKNSGMAPLYIEDLEKYYTEKGFEILHQEDLSYTLTEFYETALKNAGKMDPEELEYYRKFVKKTGHESKIYLNLGGKTHIGFKYLVLRKK